jgi:hypothetical protein
MLELGKARAAAIDLLLVKWRCGCRQDSLILGRDIIVISLLPFLINRWNQLDLAAETLLLQNKELSSFSYNDRKLISHCSVSQFSDTYGFRQQLRLREPNQVQIIHIA